MKTPSLTVALALTSAAVYWVSRSIAADAPPVGNPAQETAKPAAETVELFAAMKAGKLEVRVIQKDASGGNVLIANKTDRPLSVKLPDAFAGVHVLAQYAGGSGSSLGGAQGTGGSMGSGGGGGGAAGGAGQGGNFFNVAPEKTGKVPFVSVCLEHGKPDPRAAMKYEMHPLERLSDKPQVRETLVLLGRGAITQRVAQIIAWHVNNGLSWDELAAKHVERLGAGGNVPYFSGEEIRAAMYVDREITKTLEAREKGTSVPKL